MLRKFGWNGASVPLRTHCVPLTFHGVVLHGKERKAAPIKGAEAVLRSIGDGTIYYVKRHMALALAPIYVSQCLYVKRHMHQAIGLFYVVFGTAKYLT